jgi:hypothetical protein
VDGSRARGRPKIRWMDSLKASLERMVMNVEEARRCVQDRGEWRRVVYSRFVRVCLSVVWGRGALELLAVTVRNSGVGLVLSCLGHPETYAENGRVLTKKTRVSAIFFLGYLAINSIL